MNRNDDRDIFRNAANGIDPYHATSSYTGTGSRQYGRDDDSSFMRNERDDWDRNERWGRGGRSMYGGSQGSYGGMGSSSYGRGSSYGGYGYGDDERYSSRGMYGQGSYGQGSYGQGMYGQGGSYGSSYDQNMYGRGSYGREGSWDRDRSRSFWGRDDDRDTWGRRSREDERGLGERIADFFRREFGTEDNDRDRDRDRFRGEREHRGGWYGREHEEPSLLDKVKGAFTGKGPKGWKRSDERIREDVCERLAYHPSVDATNIEIQVKDGEVTLMGSVDDRRSKRLAEDIVEDVRGVSDVHNQLRVMPQTSTSTYGTTGTTGTLQSQQNLSSTTTSTRR